MDKILEIKNLTVRLKHNKFLVLNNISLEIYSGDVLAIDGLNGSGKSTLIRLILGNIDDYIVESGEIIYHPFSTKNVLSFDRQEMLDYHASIGYVPQKDNYEGLNKVTIEDLIDDAVSASHGDKQQAVTLFDKYFNKVNVSLRSVPAKLSGGEQRMISIFLGLVCKPSAKLMIVDEPLNNLDFDNVMKISDLLNDIKNQNRDSAMLVVTHCKIITCITRQRR